MSEKLKRLRDERNRLLMEERKQAWKKSPLVRYPGVIARELIQAPGVVADAYDLPARAYIAARKYFGGNPYDPEPYAKTLEKAFDKVTGNAFKDQSNSEKLVAAGASNLLPGKIFGAGKTIMGLGALGDVAARQILNSSPDSHASSMATGVILPLILGKGKNVAQSLAHNYRVSKIPYVEKSIIQDISHRAGAENFLPYTHEVSGKSLHKEAAMNAAKKSANDIQNVKDELNKTLNNQSFHIKESRAQRKKSLSDKRTYSQAYLNKDDLQDIAKLENENIGQSLIKGAEASKSRWDRYLQKEYAKMEEFNKDAKISADQAIEWFSEKFNKLDKANLREMASNTPAGKTIKSIMGLKPDASLKSFEQNLYKLEPTTLNFYESKKLMDSLKDSAGDLTGLFGPTAKKELNQLRHHMRVSLEDAIGEHSPELLKHYQNTQKKSGLKQEHIEDPLNAILKQKSHPSKAFNASTAEKGIEANTLEIARKTLPLEEQRVLGNTILKELGFNGGDFSHAQLRQKFLSMPQSSQRSVLKMLDPDTRGKLKAHVNHPGVYEEINKKLPSYEGVDRSARMKAKDAANNFQPETSISPSEHFSRAKENIVKGKEPLRGHNMARGIINDAAKNSLGEFDISKLRSAKNTMQPEVWAKLESKLPPQVINQLEQGISELSFLDKMVKKPHGIEAAGEALAVAAPKTKKTLSFFERRYNTEKRLPKIKEAYEIEKAGGLKHKPELAKAALRSTSSHLYGEDSPASKLEELYRQRDELLSQMQE